MNSQILPLHRDLDIVGPMSREPALPIGALLVDAGRLTHDEAERIHDYQKKVGLPFAAYEPDSPAVEHLRSLRAQLMLRWFENDTGHQSALAIVTPGPGEGRSYITANLAVLFSQMGKRTLVIDADLRKPRQHHIFGLPGKIGLSALLAGRAGAEVMCEIKQLPGLTVLPAGVLPPNPQELLSRPQFQRLIQSLSGMYEVILVDTPPASAWADASTVAARSGAALMVTCRDRSSMPRVIKLSEDLREFGVTVVGAVLNGAGTV